MTDLKFERHLRWNSMYLVLAGTVKCSDRTSHFYFRPLPNDESGLPRFGKHLVGRNTLARIIPDTCKAAGIEGCKTGHSGKVTCTTRILVTSSLRSVLGTASTPQVWTHWIRPAICLNGPSPSVAELGKENTPVEAVDDKDDFYPWTRSLNVILREYSLNLHLLIVHSTSVLALSDFEQTLSFVCMLCHNARNYF